MKPSTGLRVNQLCCHHLGPFNFQLETGQCLGVSGASGIGKTLLLRALADIEPHQGDVIFNGQYAQQVAAHEWRRRVALLPAESQWWHELVQDHFTTGFNDYWSQLGFTESTLAWSIHRLSSGERQRLALLRLLENQPELLLLDEPTANLDVEQSQRLEQLVLNYQKGYHATVIWVSHDLDQIQRIADSHLQIISAKDIQLTCVKPL